jgi:hypothetical protein
MTNPILDAIRAQIDQITQKSRSDTPIYDQLVKEYEENTL